MLVRVPVLVLVFFLMHMLEIIANARGNACGNARAQCHAHFYAEGRSYAGVYVVYICSPALPGKPAATLKVAPMQKGQPAHSHRHGSKGSTVAAGLYFMQHSIIPIAPSRSWHVRIQTSSTVKQWKGNDENKPCTVLCCG